VRIAIISDTHSRPIPPACRQRLAAADVILHAGDLSSIAVLEQLEALGPPVHAVAGNIEEPEVRLRLPARRVVEVEAARIGLLHDAGPAKGRLARMRAAFPECDAVVFGHSHIPLLERDDAGFAIFNPGSPTDRRRQPHHTMGEATVEERCLVFEILRV
jgi:putative phosphoesterase